jgi:pyruvate/2-oxoglutarate dehydrogenase complex dihydrolipoamide dehydrogenase (E3) component
MTSPTNDQPTDDQPTDDQDEFDAVVIGTGSAGKPLAGELARAGWSVLAVEQALVGGECAYLACIPSKAMLLSAREHRARVGPAGSSTPDRAAYAAAVANRDRTTRNRDDSGEADDLEKDGVTLVREQAVVDGHRVTIGTRTVRWRRALVLATGAEAVVPPIDGLATAAAAWTSPDALSADELPDRLTILGGGAIGCELAQVYASFGSAVTLIEAAPTLLPRESDWVGTVMATVLRQVGVEVRTGTEVTAVEPAGGETDMALVRTGDGPAVIADRILVAVGKKPRTEGFGLDSLGISAAENGALEVDARCRVVTADTADVYAIGDLTGLAPYTHTANYHARIVAAHLLGHGLDADHVGIPRVVYTDPPVLCVGETEKTAKDHGTRYFTEYFDATQTSRSAIERTLDPEDERPAGLRLIADADTGVLIGASAIGPEADSWAAELALAVRTRTTVHTLAQHLHAFPSWTEAIHVPARALAEKITVPTD